MFVNPDPNICKIDRYLRGLVWRYARPALHCVSPRCSDQPMREPHGGSSRPWQPADCEGSQHAAEQRPRLPAAGASAALGSGTGSGSLATLRTGMTRARAVHSLALHAQHRTPAFTSSVHPPAVY